MPGTSLVGKLPEYFQSVEEVDALIGRLISTLAEIDLLKSTIIFMTADHGGKGTSHGQSTMEELEIPWIISGPGVPPGHEIRSAVNTYDLAPTIAWIFGLKAPDYWIGKPVLEAFAK